MPDEAVAVVVAAVAAAVALALAVRKGKTVFFSYMSQQHLPWTYSKQLTFAVFLFMPAGRNISFTDIRLITNRAGCGVGGYKVYTVAFFWGTVSIVYMLWWPCLANIFGWILNPPRSVAACHQGLDQRSASLSEDFILREVLPRFGHGIDSLYSRTDVETLGKIVWPLGLYWVWLYDRNQNIILFVGTRGEASSDRWKHFSLASWHNTQNLQVLQLRGPSAPIGVLNDAWKWCRFAVVRWYVMFYDDFVMFCELRLLEALFDVKAVHFTPVRLVLSALLEAELDIRTLTPSRGLELADRPGGGLGSTTGNVQFPHSHSLAGFSAQRCFWDFWQHWHLTFFSVWLIICIIKECPSASDSSWHLCFFKFSGALPSRSLEVLWPKLPRWLQTSQKLDFFKASCALNLSARLLFDGQMVRCLAKLALIVISIMWPSKIQTRREKCYS